MKEGKHMSMGADPFTGSPTSQTEINMKEGKHMSMGDNPFSEHDKKEKTVKKEAKKASKGYSVVEYEK